MQFIRLRFDISNRTILGLAIALLLLVAVQSAIAAATSGGGLPSDGWFTKIRQSVTGPWAFTISILGIVGAGATLIFGGDMNGFLRTIIFLTLVLSFIIAAQNTLSGITGQGAEITAWTNMFSTIGRTRTA
ncbi:TrbC/VirB2 family protein [Robbsia sp. Bb-Pol-6]|uniref:TrbC/VirB2 family protein n=1 Tax=Robbsia betulipollinis TaxID=2981849 RepID=A0ABT3ZLA7_9BURK|nr:TrbC/VirB2 family protein [Robbsia betulipollinis]MCY0386735.1 TrbC/VirB2 family protein [Robbsia betulipollinis]